MRDEGVSKFKTPRISSTNLEKSQLTRIIHEKFFKKGRVYAKML